jgi:photosystem II stability/assembly factor-like uncharacterized protein
LEAEYWKSIPLRTEWQKKNNILGGEGCQMVFGITYAPSNHKILYLSTDTSQVWKSTDNGYTWHSVKNGFYSNGARSIIVDPINENIVFAAGFLGPSFEIASKRKARFQGIYRTKTGGDFWTFIHRTDFFRQVSKGNLFAFDSSSSDGYQTKIVFAGSYSEGLLRSIDGGETWQSVAFHGDHILDIEESPIEPGKLYVATQTGLFRYYKGVVRKLGNNLPDFPRSIAVSGPPLTIIAAVGKKGIYKSTDGGHVFFFSSKGLPHEVNFTDIAVSPVDSNLVFLSAHENIKHSPYISHDGGKNWFLPTTIRTVDNISNMKGFWYSGPFAFHPKNSQIAFTASNGRGHILKTMNGGKAWSYSGSKFTGGRMIDAVFPENGSIVFSLTDFGVVMSNNSGETFRTFRTGRINNASSSTAIDMFEKNITAAIGGWEKQGIAVSHDNGLNWNRNKKINTSINFIAYNKEDPNVIYAGQYLSLNGGDNWKKLSHKIQTMYHKNNDIVYSVAENGKTKSLILRSTNKGFNWKSPFPPAPFKAKAVTDIAVSINDADQLYVASTFGLWIYDGNKWVIKNEKNGLLNDIFGLCYISSVAVDPKDSNKIYVAKRSPGRGVSNGIFRSTDKGISWENISFNLSPNISVWSVKINPYDSSVYIGTSLGTWKLENTIKMER